MIFCIIYVSFQTSFPLIFLVSLAHNDTGMNSETRKKSTSGKEISIQLSKVKGEEIQNLWFAYFAFVKYRMQ